MSQLSGHNPRDSFVASPISTAPLNEPFGKPEFTSQPRHNHSDSAPYDTPPPNYIHEPSTPVPSSPVRPDHDSSPVADSPASITYRTRTRTRSRSNSRPLSMVQSYQPPLMDINEDTIPELQPIFTFLNSHANKLYQEGYFLKLDDQNAQGRANADRTWTECFAQLVGTVLSLWDAAELDAAGEGGEVLPKFVNLTDASIKMIESLPTRSNEEQSLQNILSISTAGRNRYLLHFNSKHSLIQWTAGIRLAMFEHSTLQEAYTGALIAGKGKTLNSIGVIMERSRTKVEEWVRVRFGAGVPWRRCWCVISPPDDKEYQKLQKDLRKKSPYDRSHPPILKGDIKFYDTRKEGKKQRKAKPIATITDAYSAYALYPQAKSLIDASTLIKLEGNILIHSDPPSSTEGFVFIMPEVPPAVTGFEMMLRYLFPTWDTFGLYGRPGRLVASTIDPRSLMFAMPKHKRYGYLEILDVTSLILSDDNASWTEREWRKRLKDLTGQRMTAMDLGADSITNRSRSNSQNKRLSFGPAAGGIGKPRVGFADGGPGSVRSSRSMSLTQRAPPRTDSAPPEHHRERAATVVAGSMKSSHTRNASDSNLASGPPPPLRYDSPLGDGAVPGRPNPARAFVNDLASTPERMSSDEERDPPPIQDMGRNLETPEPVSQPPAFSHAPGHKPQQRPYHSPEMRRANSRMSSTTLAQLAQAGGVVEVGQQNGWANEGKGNNEEQGPSPVLELKTDQRGPPSVHAHATNNIGGITANTGSGEVLKDDNPRSPGLPLPPLNTQRSKSPLNQQKAPASPAGPWGPSPGLSRSGTEDVRNPTFGPGAGPGPNSRPGTAGGHPLSNMPAPQRGLSKASPQGRPPPTGNVGPLPRVGPPTSPPPANPYKGYQHGQPGAGGRGRPTTPGDNGPLHQHTTSPPIYRKPLPLRTDSLRSREGVGFDDVPPRSPAPSNHSNGSFTRAHGIDPNVLAQVHTQNSSGRGTPQPQQEQGYVRAQRADTMRSNASSNYPESTDSPDYASTRPSTDTARSVERPRAGVLRTVGDESQGQVNKKPSFDIPSVDFGPTFNYGANQLKDKPPIPALSPMRSFSQGPRSFSPKPPPPSKSPQPPPPPRKSPVIMNHIRSESDDNTARRSVVWQPGTATGLSNSPGQAITAEQFVQQRAAAAATPLYAHQRQSSGNTLGGWRSATPTPPLGVHSRSNSQDMLQRPGSRGAAAVLDPIQRPSSRGAGAVLGGQGHGGDANLSAREQEHVARMTGTPLISMAGNKNAPQTGSGLVGAIAAREQERQQMKQGYSSQAAQYAINQRQQQQAFQNYQQQPVAPPPAGMYSNLAGRTMAGGPQSPGILMGGQQSPGLMMGGQQIPGPHGYGVSQNFINPGAQAYAQGGGWTSPGGPHHHRSPQQGNFSPVFMPQQGQFTSQLGSGAQSPRPGQQPQGRGYPFYHGQAF
ncbi:uncharacterized protein BCR38DRAFT_490063 [Pseudomassariella vexata]|uniref:PH domain-containing protein n=1 Tax=Pseudomassariella vexata TaxID=1141098 RepID=A0A1Y2DE60_9PEZI|nr:uncharacterized protein BCR38DRAFT_490063 [Pseudomassariella vexata]ORY57558.1 hypothetical protein BCR38DRAFT_490063 [Pseudomassariella vexata]